MPQIGKFDLHLRPMVRFVLRGTAGREQTVETGLDTGFDLSLAMPESVVDALGLEYVRTRPLRLANGESYFFTEYRARLMWEGIERPIRIIAKPGMSLAGMSLFS